MILIAILRRLVAIALLVPVSFIGLTLFIVTGSDEVMMRLIDIVFIDIGGFD